MNYRHAYHAGNFADVLKHLVLVQCLSHLALKPAPFRVLDTHAGTGHYDLTGPEATRTGEGEAGIRKVLAAIASAPADVRAVIEPYLQIVRREVSADGMLAAYPGSPAIIAACLRPGDTLLAHELQRDEHKQLARRFKTDRRVKVEAMDGYTAIKAKLPPPERRGLILVDPPFEQPGELLRLTEGLADGLERFRTGMFLLWYPIKDPKPIERFLRAVGDVTARYGVDAALAIELLLRPPRHPELLNGCGVVVVNPPYTLESSLEIALPWLASTLAGHSGSATVRRIRH